MLAVAAFAEDWPEFRGPTGQGASAETRVPLHWSPGKGIAWNTAIPGLGHSSPIVWGDRVFLTTATDGNKSCRILALDARSGKILWNTEVFTQDASHNRKQNSYATSTPITDGRRVYAVFADGSFAAVDFNGKLVWTHRDVHYYSEHGLGASPRLFEDLLIMPFSGSSTDPANKRVGWQIPWDKSYVLALDKNTGRERWKTGRGLSRIGHGSPLIHTVDGQPELLSPVGDVIQGFDPRTGKLKWTVPSRGEGVVPSVVTGEGLIFTSSGFEATTLRTVRAGKAEVAWEQGKGVSHIPSFVYSKPWLFSITEAGVAVCMQASTGEILWQERIGGIHWASPVLVNGLIYFTDEEGATVVIRAADRFEVVARNSIGDGPVVASMAVSGGAIFIRTHEKLYCVR
ncbi:MAG: PQQ-binding-like beta-propeller repeat protein [Bryobacteraceae bacterium]